MTFFEARLMRSPLALLMFCVSCALLQLASAQDSAALTARLHSAGEKSALDSPSLKPWHLKLDLELYDEQGKLNEQGTFEEWWSSPTSYRTVYKMPSYTATELKSSENFLRTKGSASAPMNLQSLVDEVVHPVHQENEIDQGKPDLRKQTFGKVALDCIMLDQPIKQVAYPPLGLFPTYCLDPGGDTIRASFDFGSQTTIHNQIGRFQNKTVATDITVMSANKVAGRAKVTTLQTSSAEDAAQPSSETLEKLASEHGTQVAGGVMAGNILNKVYPRYPESSRRNRSSGAVILGAIIGRDGRVHSLRLKSYPDPDLAIAAIAAVRQWVYRPYLLNGEPTDVDTIITVNFSLSTNFSFGPG